MATKPMPVHGADISHHQNGALNLPAFKRAGGKWLYHKATEGDTYVDPNYTKRRAEAAKAGIPFGAYHFARAERGDGAAEARRFIKVAAPKPGDLRPALDLETQEGLSLAEIRTWAKTFVAEVKRLTGVLPIVYTPFDLGDAVKGCLIWRPRYNNSNTPPVLPWDIWQFSNGVFGSPNSVAGLGHVDLNTMRAGLTVAQMQIPRKEPAPTPAPTKSITTVAKEVIDGKWGSGADRVKRLTKAGYDAKKVQAEVNRLLAPKPAPAPKASVTLRVATANIKNYPDMTPAQVEADMREVKTYNPDLVLWQEIGEQEDFDAIIAAFGNTAYGSTDSYSSKAKGYRGGNVTTWRRADLALLKSDLEKIGDTMGPNTAHPSQWMVRSFFDPTAPGIPQVDVFNIHLIVGAYNAQDKAYSIKHKAELRQRWDGSWKRMQKEVLASRAAGHIALFGGDWNRQQKDIPLFAPDQKWVVGGGIDSVGILLPKGFAVSTSGSKSVDLNSDHNLRLADVKVTAL